MKSGLGRGLNSLFGDLDEEEINEALDNKTGSANTQNLGEPKEIEVGLIDRNPNQPRKNFDEQALNELAQSIKTYGVVQPLIVKEQDGRYIIIAGERRWRAARIAGLKTVPCVVRDYSNQQVSEISIIENLQREDLNPIESARAIQNLINEYNLTQDEVADKIGKSRSAVANNLRLLTLPDAIIALVENNKISAGHARALLGITSAARQKEVALQIIENGLSVRDVENLVKKQNTPSILIAKPPVPIINLELKNFESQLKRVLSTKVEIKGNDTKGKIIIDYYNKDDLNRIYDILNK